MFFFLIFENTDIYKWSGIRLQNHLNYKERNVVHFYVCVICDNLKQVHYIYLYGVFFIYLLMYTEFLGFWRACRWPPRIWFFCPGWGTTEMGLETTDICFIMVRSLMVIRQIAITPTIYLTISANALALLKLQR